MERDAAMIVADNVAIISTHTLTWSVTALDLGTIWQLCNFNSHAHVERDEQNIGGVETLFISTHTLTWSVTKWVATAV